MVINFAEHPLCTWFHHHQLVILCKIIMLCKSELNWNYNYLNNSNLRKYRVQLNMGYIFHSSSFAYLFLTLIGINIYEIEGLGSYS